MAYDGLVEGLRREGRADSIHAASWFAIEFQASAALLLLFVLAARLVSPLLALPALFGGILALRGRTLTEMVLRENDRRFDTLLAYFISTFAAIVVVVGWSMWM
jgi:hypothetical protein